MAPSQIEYQEDGVEYIIEAILHKRRVQRKKGEGVVYGIEYYIKWKGLPTSENTWEPEKEIKNRALVAEFERQRQRERLRAANNGQAEDSSEKQTEIASGRYKGFNRGLEAERIAGAIFIYGVLHFLIEWKGCDEMDLVPASIVNKKVPDMVINFYEGRMIWRSLNAGRIVRNEEERLRREAQIAENREARRIPGEIPSSDAS